MLPFTAFVLPNCGVKLRPSGRRYKPQFGKTEAIVEAVSKKQKASPDLLSNRTGSSHDRNLYAANLSFQRGDKAYPF